MGVIGLPRSWCGWLSCWLMTAQLLPALKPSGFAGRGALCRAFMPKAERERVREVNIPHPAQACIANTDVAQTATS